MNYDKTPKPNLPQLKCYPDEIDMILKFYAVSDTIDDALTLKEFKRRLDVIPHAEAGLKMMNGRMLQLLYDLMATLPEAKRKSILRMSTHMKYKVYHAAPASEVGDGEAIIEIEDLNTLCKQARMNCDICFERSCNSCPLAKVFDKVLPYDRERYERWCDWEGWSKLK